MADIFGLFFIARKHPRAAAGRHATLAICPFPPVVSGGERFLLQPADQEPRQLRPRPEAHSVRGEHDCERAEPRLCLLSLHLGCDRRRERTRVRSRVCANRPTDCSVDGKKTKQPVQINLRDADLLRKMLWLTRWKHT